MRKRCAKCGILVSKNCKGEYCTHCRDRSGKIPEITLDERFSYLIGFAQMDGTMTKATRNRGRLQIELTQYDADILYEFEQLIPCNATVKERVRNVRLNGRFYKGSITVILRVCNRGFRDFMEKHGMPYGRKSETIAPSRTATESSERDYVRGLYDADGSVGFTAKGFPFVSFTTQSEAMKEYVSEYISRVTGKPIKTTNRNKRDGVYNIMVTKEDAALLAGELYYDGCLSVQRKFENARKVSEWKP